MIEKIKQLREEIDGLSSLVKTLKPKSFIVDVSKLPKGKRADDFIKEFISSANMYPMTLVDSIEGTNPIVQILESHEIQKAHDSLILAKAWLGKILGELGETTPYQNDGKRKDVKDIEPAAERRITGTMINDDGKEKNHIEKVDWLRQEIQKVLTETMSVIGSIDRGTINKDMVVVYLSEARFWLGFELQRIREEQTK